MFVSLFCCTGLICNGQQITQQTTVTVLNENGSPAVNAIAFRLSKNDLAIRQTVMADRTEGRIVFRETSISAKSSSKSPHSDIKT